MINGPYGLHRGWSAAAGWSRGLSWLRRLYWDLIVVPARRCSVIGIIRIVRIRVSGVAVGSRIAETDTEARPPAPIPTAITAMPSTVATIAAVPASAAKSSSVESVCARAQRTGGKSQSETQRYGETFHKTIRYAPARHRATYHTLRWRKDYSYSETSATARREPVARIASISDTQQFLRVNAPGLLLQSAQAGSAGCTR